MADYVYYQRPMRCSEHSSFTPFADWGAILSTKITPGQSKDIFVTAEELASRLAIENSCRTAEEKNGRHHTRNTLRSALTAISQKAIREEPTTAGRVILTKQWDAMMKQLDQGTFAYLPEELRSKQESIPDFLKRTT